MNVTGPNDESLLVQVMAVKHQAITRASVAPDLYHNMVSPGHSELNNGLSHIHQPAILFRP